MPKIITPNINGFSISKLKTMQGEDGYIIRCCLHRNGKLLGEFFDKGDGSEYMFYPCLAHSQSEIEEILQSFPMIESEDEGYPSINWNIGILVDRLIEKKELLKLFRQAKKEKNSLIAVHDTEHNFDYTFLCSETMTGDKLKSELASLTIEKDIKHFKWTRFDSEEDFNEHLSISI